MDKLTVVILNYRTPEMTVRCAETALKALPDAPSRLIIVENGSGDGSDEILGRWHQQHKAKDQIDLVVSATNKGFSGGNNLGLAKAQSDYVLLLNSDAFLQPDSLTSLLKAADETPKAGLIHPTLIDPDGTPQISQFRDFKPTTELLGASNLGMIAKLFPKAVTAIPLTSNEAPHWVSFAAVLIRRSMIDEIGGMDDGFFLYYEDAEYCRRARQAGWSIHHAKDAFVVHERGGSSPVKKLSKSKKRLPTYYYESRSRYYQLHYGKAGLWFANMLWYGERLIAYARFLAFQKPNPVCQKAAQDIWRGFGKDVNEHAR
ncbi:MAG: glycosyltransferase family 2 protein [Pseudomonadota bacterium]